MNDTTRSASSPATGGDRLKVKFFRTIRNPSRFLTRFYSFLGVGLAGVVADAAIFFTALSLGAHFLSSRLLASLIAITLTCLLNRLLTFSQGRLNGLLTEYLRYVVASSVGAVANAAISFPVSQFDAAYRHLPAYVAGAVAGLIVNFFLYDNVVFTGKRDEHSKESRNA